MFIKAPCKVAVGDLVPKHSYACDFFLVFFSCRSVGAALEHAIIPAQPSAFDQDQYEILVS